MNNPNPKLRYALGISALTAFSLVMVGCGGSSSSAPNTTTPTNGSPTAPLITTGPTSAVTKHQYTYNLVSTDPEGDPITYSLAVANADATITGSVLTYKPTAPAFGAPDANVMLSVVAKDNHSNTSPIGTITINVKANRAPVFASGTSIQAIGSGPAVPSTFTYAAAAVDPDSDSVTYAVKTGSVSILDNTGATVANPWTGNVPPIAAGVVSFTGLSVPAGKTAVTVTFTVQATDVVAFGSDATDTTERIVTATYFSGNTAPVILTSSLPNLPLNHYIPTSAGGTGFALLANDPDSVAQTNALVWSMTSTTPGVVLSSSPTSLSTGPIVGSTAYIMTNSAFVPLSSTAQSITVNVTVTDPGGLTFTRTLTISPVSDSVPTLNSNVYTETVSGVVAFDSSRVKNALVGPTRANFYPGPIDWVGFPQYTNGFYGTPYLGVLETTGGIDAAATNNAFSNYLNAYPGGFLGALADNTLPAKGWNARTIFKDNEGDGVSYAVLPGSVFVAGTPYNTVGQTFTLSPLTLPLIPGGTTGTIFGNASPDVSEYPMVDVNTGTIQWRPVMVSEAGPSLPLGDPPFFVPAKDNFLNPIWSEPTVWSFIVEASENVFVPPGNTPTVPAAGSSNKGQQQYVIKVQPNNAPWIGPLTTIPGAALTVPGVSPFVVATTTLSVGGGASVSPTAYGRPSIQEPESRRYDVTSATDLAFSGIFDYTKANTVKPAVWRWLMAMPGGDPTIPLTADVEIYDGDQTTTSGHQDTIFATMGVPTVPAADTTLNFPTLAAGSASFYNPWLMAGNAGAFQVNWGPNRIQYLIARVTASAAYAFPVEVRDQYERINNGNLAINPIFGTVRFTNARTRALLDSSTSGSGAFRRGGTLVSGANAGDPTINVNTPFTFTYLPFPGVGSTSETNFGTFFFNGNHPASGTLVGAGNRYTAASWITLDAIEAPFTSFHTGNPLNDETGTFNVPAYASAYNGSATQPKTSDWKTYSYTYVNGANPTAPVAENRHATGTYVDHEVRAQVIPSNSPYLFAFTPEDGAAGFFGNFPTELQGSTLQIPRKNAFNLDIPANVGPTGTWFDMPIINGGSGGAVASLATAKAHGWVYNLYQGEVDMQNAEPGRTVTLSNIFGAPTTSLRWAYSWPTQVTNANLGIVTGGTNKWEKGDVMQIAVPNQSANSRYFFVGDGSINDPNASQIYGWGFMGMTSTTGIVDTDTVFGTSTMSAAGVTVADNTPFHVPSNSIWLSNNLAGPGTPGFLNTPNRTTFSPGSTSTQVPYNLALRGYISFGIAAGQFAFSDPANFESLSVPSVGGPKVPPALLDLTLGDNTYFLWLKHDTAQPTAWGTWDASQMIPGATYTATGGTTTVPAFAMANGVNNSTLPASFLQDAQISMATSSVPGQNHAANVDVKTDASLNNANIINPQGWARSEWGLAAPTMGYQPLGSTNVRLVNPKFDSTVVAKWNNQRGPFHTTTVANVSTDGGVRDSAIVYGVRRRVDENGNANAELGLAGIEPGSPLLAQWYNLQLGTDVPLDSSTVAATNMKDVVAAWPKVFNFYSPFSGNAAWANVMEFKVNFLVGVTYPDANAADPTNVSTNTLWKVPAQMANVFPLGEALTDPTNNTPTHTINPGNPIVRPIQFLRITDFTANTAPGTFNTTLDLVTSNPTNAATGAGAMVLAGSPFIQARSNVKVSFQASVNNQVVPSGYIVDLFLLNGTATATAQPVLLSTIRTGHIGGSDAIQNLFLPSMHSYSGLDGNGVPQNAVYFFRVRTVWHKGITFEKQPTKQSIPMAYADYISAPFVTN